MIYTVTLNPAVDQEKTVPELAFNSVLRASEVRTDWGGKGFNVSRLLASIGSPSVAMGFVGGSTGQMLKRGLGDLGIQTDFVEIEGDTRVNVSIVAPNDDRYLKVNEAGPNIQQAEEAALFEKVERLASRGDWWVFAGSLPRGVAADTYARLIEVVHEQGAYAALDASGEAMTVGCNAEPDLVKPNWEEALVLAGLPADTDINELPRVVQMITDMGAKKVVVSLGKEGACFFDGGVLWRGTSPSIEEANPIGAGDSMLAGMVYQLDKGASPEDVLRWGLACGAATASLSGTAVGTRPLVEELLEGVGTDCVTRLT